jgi:hypothetical protein
MGVKIETSDGGLICAKTDIMEVTKSDDNAIIAVISTEAIDSDGDIVHQRKTKNGGGWDLSRFNAAPVLTWQHDLNRPNISGEKTRAKVRTHETKGDALYLEPMTFDQEDDFAVGIESKIRRNIVKEFSVGFRIKAGERTPRKGESDQIEGLDIWGATLLENAVCNRGANQETEVFAKHLIGIPTVTKDLEDAGSSEAIEAKEEIQELNRRIDELENIVKQFGDIQNEEAAERMLLAKERRDKELRDKEKTADELLKTLSRLGIAV